MKTLLRATRGFSLVELLTVLTMLGILAMIAAPSLTRTVHIQKVRSTLNRFAVDMYYARALAAREGRRVYVTFAEGDAVRCPAVGNFAPISRYTITVAGAGTAAKSVTFGDDAAGVCVLATQTTTATIWSSGRASSSLARSLLATSGPAADSLQVAFGGRIRRSF